MRFDMDPTEMTRHSHGQRSDRRVDRGQPVASQGRILRLTESVMPDLAGATESVDGSDELMAANIPDGIYVDPAGPRLVATVDKMDPEGWSSYTGRYVGTAAADDGVDLREKLARCSRTSGDRATKRTCCKPRSTPP